MIKSYSWVNKLIIILIGSCLIFTQSEAQFTRYVVNLKNKGGTPYSFTTPTAYLSQRAIDRRTRFGIAIDSTDLPVTPSYITQIRNIPNVPVLNISKWHNAVAIQTSDPNAITTINALSFVQSTAPISARTTTTKEKLIANEQPYNAPMVSLCAPSARTRASPAWAAKLRPECSSATCAARSSLAEPER